MFGTNDEPGLIPRCAEYLFAEIAKKSGAADIKEIKVSGSFLEVYREQIRDLLDPNCNSNLKIRENKRGEPYVQGLTNRKLSSEAEIKEIIEVGSVNRAVGVTKMNEQSSRSHSLLIITVVQCKLNGTVVEGKLNLADLAGCERISDTGVTGIGLSEAQDINKQEFYNNQYYKLEFKLNFHPPIVD